MDLYMGQFYDELIKDKDFLKERNEKLEKVLALEEELCKDFSPQQRELLRKMLSADTEVWNMESEHTFAKGVKIGMLLQTALDKIKL